MLKNWKTTIVGVGGGLVIGINALIQAVQSGALDGKSGMALIGAITLALVGAFAKDHDKSGTA